MKDQREVVLLALLSYEKNNTFSNVLVKRTLDGCSSMNAQERAFIKRLLEGVIERKTELDEKIRAYTGRPAARLHPAVCQILRMGLYQILYMDAVPDSAACNESVRLAKLHAPARLSGFVNGVLRSAARDHEARDGDGRKEPEEARYSMPQWLITMWEAQLGPQQTQRLLEALMKIRPVSIRLCGAPSEEETHRILSLLCGAGVSVEKGKWAPDSFRLRRTSDLTRLPGFSEGLWTVQDESSMLAVQAAGLTGTETVYDVCAAPGGKSFLAADLLRTRGNGTAAMVRSFDLTEKKAKRIREGAGRLGLTNLTVQCRDARLAWPADESKADVLLCDLPCSGLGVIGKKRDIKYRASEEGIEELQKLQRQILTASVPYLKRGGVLLYSTCTISRAENEENAEWIRQELGLAPDDLAPFLPPDIPGIRGNMLQLLPHVHDTDGFFIARFRKP